VCVWAGWISQERHFPTPPCLVPLWGIDPARLGGYLCLDAAASLRPRWFRDLRIRQSVVF
jgi:hypothetical protein